MTAATALIENLDNVKRLARSFAKFGHDPEDLEQEACVLFLELWDTRPEGTSASNFIRFLSWRLMDFTLEQHHKRQITMPHPEYVLQMDDFEQISDLVMSLGTDARSILELMRTVHRELACYFYYPMRKTTKQPLIEYMRDCLGWKRSRAVKCVKELEQACRHTN